MAGLFSRGTMKPPLGAQINLAHPLGTHCVLAVPFNDGCGRPSIVYGAPSIGYPRQAASFLRAVTITEPPTASLPSWTANQHGLCTTQASGVYWRFEDSNWVPTTACTMCIIRRRTNTVQTGGAWGCGGASNTYAFSLLLPYSDGTVYWDFGGWSGPNRISAAGLSMSTVIPERWIVHAGPQGSAIWQNGVKVASQATAITRTAGGLTFDLSNLLAQEINYVALYDTQWSDELCRWWSAEPYVPLYAEQARTYEFFGDRATAAAGHPTHYYAQQRQQAL
jgi:hypothetical protein